MSIGEQIWLGTGKTQLMSVRGVTADGVAVEYTWMGKLKGIGKAEGVNDTVLLLEKNLLLHQVEALE